MSILTSIKTLDVNIVGNIVLITNELLYIYIS